MPGNQAVETVEYVLDFCGQNVKLVIEERSPGSFMTVLHIMGITPHDEPEASIDLLGAPEDKATAEKAQENAQFEIQGANLLFGRRGDSPLGNIIFLLIEEICRLA